MTAVYLYGFGRADALAGFAAPGLEPGRDAGATAFGDVAAVVSAVEPGSVAPASDPPTAEEQARIVAHAVRHQEVVAAAFARGAVLPVRYGAVFSSPDALSRLIDAHRDRIAAFLARAEGREEWAVKAVLAPKTAAEWLLAQDPELSARRAQLPAAPGARYLLERRLLADAERRAVAWAAEAAAAVRAELAPLADEARELRRAAADAGQQAVAHDAFLIARDRVTEWLARLDAAAARLAGTGLELSATGPWPPATFAPPLA